MTNDSLKSKCDEVLFWCRRENTSTSSDWKHGYVQLLVEAAPLLAKECQRLVGELETIEERAIGSVLSIRCMKHRAVQQQNTSEHAGGECGGCIAEERDKEKQRADTAEAQLRETKEKLDTCVAALKGMTVIEGTSVLTYAARTTLKSIGVE